MNHAHARTAAPRRASAGGVPALQTEFYRRLEPWSGGRSLYNFTARPDNTPADARGAFDEATLDRLREVKKDWDPADRFRFTVRIP